MSVDVDLVVVGAGPAGSAAAIAAARAGLDTLVVDKARFPRDKFCGDGLTTAALRHLEDLGVDPVAVESWFPAQNCWIRAPNGLTTRFQLPDDGGQYLAIARRRDLDAAIVDRARAAGAKVEEGHALLTAVEHQDAIELDIDGLGTVRARWAIGADGMWSPLRRQLGLRHEGYRGEWHAFRQYFTGVGPVAATDMFVSFEHDLVPGYFWSFPLPDGTANVGFGIQRGGWRYNTRDMKQLWPDLLRRPHLRAILGPDAEPEDTHRAWPIPARVDSMPPTSRRALFVGDAVAACDVMSGEGIAQALISGIRAAEAVADAGPTGDAAVTYRRALRQELVADHRMSALLVRGLDTPAKATAAIRIASFNDWTRRNFARWLFEDYPRALIATPRRWTRGVITRPGAYREPAT